MHAHWGERQSKIFPHRQTGAQETQGKGKTQGRDMATNTFLYDRMSLTAMHGRRNTHCENEELKHPLQYLQAVKKELKL